VEETPGDGSDVVEETNSFLGLGGGKDAGADRIT